MTKKIFNTDFINLFIILVACLLLNLPTLLNFSPLTEGWWEFYHWAEKSKNITLYDNQKIYFPPLHIFIFGSIFEYFDYNFLHERIVGLFYYAISGFLLYYLFSILTNKSSALFGTLLAVSLEYTFNSSYIIRDYQTSLVIFLSLFFITLISINSENYKKIQKIFLNIACGCFLACIFLIKQNVFLAVLFIFIINELIKQNLLNTIFKIIGFSIIIYIFLQLYGSGLIDVYFNNDAKGSALTLLIRFFSTKSSYVIIFSIFYLLLLISIIYYFDYVKILKLKAKNLFLKYSLFIPIISIFLLPFFIFLILFLKKISSFEFIVIIASLLIITYSFAEYFIKNNFINKEKFNLEVIRSYKFWLGFTTIPFYFFILIYFLFFASGLSYSNSIFFIGYAVSFVLYKLKFVPNIFFKISILLLVLFLSVYKFLNTPYQWWGYGYGSTLKSTFCNHSIPVINGLCVDKNHYEIYSKILEYKNISQDNIFAYPNIPLIYMILDSRPITTLPVQWFDVSSKNDFPLIKKELDQAKPKIIFWLKPPSRVYSGHFDLRKEVSLMKYLDDYLVNKINSKNYRIEYVKTLYDFNTKNYDSAEPLYNHIEHFNSTTKLISLTSDEMLVELENVKNYNDYLKIYDHYNYLLNDHWQFIILKLNE